MHTILGSNNPLFGLKHFLFVGISAVCIALLFLFVRKKSFKTVCAILFYGGLLSELIKFSISRISTQTRWAAFSPKRKKKTKFRQTKRPPKAVFFLFVAYTGTPFTSFLFLPIRS